MRRSAVRKFIKQERRMTRALYRAGMLKLILSNKKATLKDELFWMELSIRGVPEVCYGICDSYAGDCSEYSLVSTLADSVLWDLSGAGAGDDFDPDESHFWTSPKALKYQAMRDKGRAYLVKVLENLPVVRCDHAINTVLNHPMKDM